MLRDVLVLTYYACVARTVIGVVYILNKARSYNTMPIPVRAHRDIFGDVRYVLHVCRTAFPSLNVRLPLPLRNLEKHVSRI